MPITDGVAVFDGLTLPESDNGDHVFEITTTLPTVGEVSSTTNPVAVATRDTGRRQLLPIADR